jgi:hypothetical protein
MMGKKTSAVFFSKWMDKYRGSSESQKVGQGQLERRSIKASLSPAPLENQERVVTKSEPTKGIAIPIHTPQNFM